MFAHDYSLYIGKKIFGVLQPTFSRLAYTAFQSIMSLHLYYHNKNNKYHKRQRANVHLCVLFNPGTPNTDPNFILDQAHNLFSHFCKALTVLYCRVLVASWELSQVATFLMFKMPMHFTLWKTQNVFH
ncbi:hypothetical protein ACJX0J_011996 [Zea mays]